MAVRPNVRAAARLRRGRLALDCSSRHLAARPSTASSPRRRRDGDRVGRHPDRVPRRRVRAALPLRVERLPGAPKEFRAFAARPSCTTCGTSSATPPGCKRLAADHGARACAPTASRWARSTHPASARHCQTGGGYAADLGGPPRRLERGASAPRTVVAWPPDCERGSTVPPATIGVPRRLTYRASRPRPCRTTAREPPPRSRRRAGAWLVVARPHRRPPYARTWRSRSPAPAARSSRPTTGGTPTSRTLPVHAAVVGLALAHVDRRRPAPRLRAVVRRRPQLRHPDHRGRQEAQEVEGVASTTPRRATTRSTRSATTPRSRAAVTPTATGTRSSSTRASASSTSSTRRRSATGAGTPAPARSGR